MPVQIGAEAHHFNDPTGLLSDCHRRIEMFLGSLQAVAEAIHRPPTEDVRRALESALRYFSQAAPKHTADEEESLFPRLRDTANPEVMAALARLDELEREHRWADCLHSQVERIGVKYLSTGSLSNEEVESFGRSIRELRSMYQRHIQFEDDVIFPLAARALTDQDKSAIASAFRKQSGRQVARVHSAGRFGIPACGPNNAAP